MAGMSNYEVVSLIQSLKPLMSSEQAVKAGYICIGLEMGGGSAAVEFIYRDLVAPHKREEAEAIIRDRTPAFARTFLK